MQTKQEIRGKRSKENSSKEVLCQCWNFLYSTLSLTEQHNKSQGSVVLKQNRAVSLGIWNNRSDPIHSPLSLGFILAVNAQMLWLFFGRNDCGHLLHIFSFPGHFHFIKLQSMCFVCGEEGLTHTVVVSVAVYIGGSSSPRIRPLCAVKR